MTESDRRGVVAIIPARGGSKGVPGKNLAAVGGRSLLTRAIDAAEASGTIDEIVVSTDAADIAQEARRSGATVVDRPAELATDDASSESALVDALRQLADSTGIRPRIVVFLQCTSPFISATALARAVQRVATGEMDCVFSAVESYEFFWELTDDGRASAVNHNASERLRRQDRNPQWVETGAFYVMRADGFESSQHRFFGRIGVEPVAPSEAIEIDTGEDLALARAAAALVANPPPDALGSIDLLVTDFDGVHTDDRATVDGNGIESVTINRRDGHGVKLLRNAGIDVVILSTETNPVVSRRASKLSVECIQGVEDKAAELRRIAESRNIELANVGYLGNDVNDLPALRLAGVALCPADAHPEVRNAAHMVLESIGGAGAVREAAELILSLRT